MNACRSRGIRRLDRARRRRPPSGRRGSRPSSPGRARRRCRQACRRRRRAVAGDARGGSRARRARVGQRAARALDGRPFGRQRRLRRDELVQAAPLDGPLSAVPLLEEALPLVVRQERERADRPFWVGGGPVAAASAKCPISRSIVSASKRSVEYSTTTSRPPSSRSCVPTARSKRDHGQSGSGSGSSGHARRARAGARRGRARTAPGRSGVWLGSRCGLSASTSRSNGSSWCAKASRAVVRTRSQQLRERAARPRLPCGERACSRSSRSAAGSPRGACPLIGDADDDVLRPGVAVEQRVEAGEQDGEERDVARARRARAARPPALPAASPGARRRRRSWRAGAACRTAGRAGRARPARRLRQWAISSSSRRSRNPRSAATPRKSAYWIGSSGSTGGRPASAASYASASSVSRIRAEPWSDTR